MSLRHAMPAIGRAPFKRASEPLRAPAVPRAPVSVTFRNGGDLSAVVAAVAANTNIELEAAVGSGKTVRVPAELVKQLRVPLVHTFPSRLLAFDQHQYVSRHVEMETNFIDDVDTPMPNRGITFMSNATAVARILKFGKLADHPIILYLDEVHESDAYTYVMRTLFPSLKEVLHTVHASATFAVEQFRRRETDGDVVVRKYSSDDTVNTWDPLDKGKPWSMGNIRGNVIMFVDSNEHATRLVSEYDQLGYKVVRMTARMDIQAFVETLEIVRDKRGDIVIMIADYSFRSGFTFDVSSVVDSGTVSYVHIDDRGCASTQFRSAYMFEQYQAAGRAGRIAGTKAICYSPEGNPSMSMCDLEEVEMDAAAIIIRLCGYRVPPAIAHSKFANGSIPKNLDEVINGRVPIRCYPDSAFEPFVSLGYFDFESKSDESRPNSPVPVSPRSDVKRASTATTVSVSDDWTDQFGKLDQWAVRARGGQTVQIGVYYHADGVKASDTTSRMFPDGLQSVLRFFDIKGASYRISRIMTDDRYTAICCVLNRYNLVTAELYAISGLIRSAPEVDHKRVRVDAVRRWAQHLRSVVADLTSELQSLAPMLEQLCDDFSELHIIDAMDDIVKDLAQIHMDAMVEFGVNDLGSSPDDYLRDIRSSIAYDKDRAKVSGRLHEPFRGFVESCASTTTLPTVGSRRASDTSRRSSRAVVPVVADGRDRGLESPYRDKLRSGDYYYYRRVTTTYRDRPSPLRLDSFWKKLTIRD